MSRFGEGFVRQDTFFAWNRSHLGINEKWGEF